MLIIISREKRLQKKYKNKKTKTKTKKKRIKTNKNQKKTRKKNPVAKNIRLSDRFTYPCAVGGIRVYDERINYTPPRPNEFDAEKSGETVVEEYKYYTQTAG